MTRFPMPSLPSLHPPRSLAARAGTALLLATLVLATAAPTAHPAQPATAAWTPMEMPLDSLGLLTGFEPASDLDAGIGPGTFLAISKSGGDRTLLGDLTPIHLGAPNVGLNGCTANWLWKDQQARLYLGTAGHCLLPSSATATHGPDDFDASAVRVYACHGSCPLGGLSALADAMAAPSGWVELGPVAYAFQTAAPDLGPDFGLVRIPDSVASLLDPALKGWGGPEGTASIAPGDLALLHGNGAGLAETMAGKDRAGVFLHELAGGLWLANLPISGGDSGSAVGLATSLDGPVVAAGIATHADCNPTQVYGSPLHSDPAFGACTEASTVAAGTTVAKAALMARDAGLCIEVVLDGEDLGDLAPAADCL